MDTLTPVERSERMSRVRSKDTKPELIVRHLVHRMGYRYRLHVSHLPGKPDMVFPKLRKIIFVHGCFWHRHNSSCALTRWPKSNLDFWKPKLEENHRHDEKNIRKARRMGYSVMVIWECQVKNTDKLERRIRKFLGGEK